MGGLRRPLFVMSILEVRQIIADEQRYYEFRATGNGTQTRWAVEQFPILSLVGSPKPTTPTFDGESGLLTFSTIEVDHYSVLLSDAAIQAALDRAGDDVVKAAAFSLETIAANQALLLKKIKIDGLDVDGPALARALRESAASLRKQDAMSTTFTWAEQVNDPMSWNERMRKETLRGS